MDKKKGCISIRESSNHQDVTDLETNISTCDGTHYPWGRILNLHENNLCANFFKHPTLSRTESSKNPVTCRECSNIPPKKRSMPTQPTKQEEKSSLLTCLECHENFCGGREDSSHAYWHAKITGHYWFVNYDEPLRGWCYRCNSLVRIKVFGWNMMQMWSVGNGHERSRFRRLKNPGVSYFNSVLRNILSMDRLREYFTNLHPQPHGIISGLMQLFKEICAVGRSDGVVNPDTLLQSVRRRCLLQRNDASHDWLTCLLIGLTIELSILKLGWPSNVVYETFAVQVFSAQPYAKCRHSPTRCEQFCVLPLVVPSKGVASQFNQNSSVTLEDCLNVFVNQQACCWTCYRVMRKSDAFPQCYFKGALIQQRFLPHWIEELDRNLSSSSACEVSSLQENQGKLHGDSHKKDDKKGKNLKTQKDKSALYKRYIVDKPPPILAIQLIRTSDDFTKLHNHVEFEEILDLKPYMHPRFGEKDNTRYRLIGVVGHEAGNMEAGGDIAYVCQKGNNGGKMEEGSELTWSRISDDDARPVPSAQVLQSEAFNLFYERTNV